MNFENKRKIKIRKKVGIIKVYTIYKQNTRVDPYVVEIVVDEESDVEDLPTTKVTPGSVCIVTATSNVYMLNNQKEWIQI